MPRPRHTFGRFFCIAAVAASSQGILPMHAIAQTADDEFKELEPEDIFNTTPPAYTGLTQVDPLFIDRITAPYLSDEERKVLRIQNGMWLPGDLDTPTRRAYIALMLGLVEDPALSHPKADPNDRTEAALIRGELREVLEMTPNPSAKNIRAARLHAAALEGLGSYDKAEILTDNLIDEFTAKQTKPTALEQVEYARVMLINARLRGNNEHHQRIVHILGILRQIDATFWPAGLAEAELLYEKSQLQSSQQTLEEVLMLNPRVGRAYGLLATNLVDEFAVDNARQMATIAAKLTGEMPNGQAMPFSLFAAHAQVRACLRERIPEAAFLTLDPMLKRFPKNRELLALQAAATAITFDIKKTDSLLAAFDTLSPGSATALFEVGRALAENRQYELAAEYLQRAVERQPNWAKPRITQGLLEMQSGRNEQALKALRLAQQYDPFNQAVKNCLKCITAISSWPSVQNDRFIVRYPPLDPNKPENSIGYNINEIMANEMLAAMDDIHTKVSGLFDHDPGPIAIEVMPDNFWFGVRVSTMPSVHTVAASTGPLIALEIPALGINRKLGEYDWARVVTHEYAHTVTLAKTNNRIPHWFTEAAAVYAEPGARSYKWCERLAYAYRANRLFDFNNINIRFARELQRGDREQAYAQSHWMFEYMVERFGEETPKKLMVLYADGTTEADAFPQVLGITRETFFNDFKPWAGKQLKSWGMLYEGPTLSSLIADWTYTTPAPGKTMSSAEIALRDFALSTGSVLTRTGGTTNPNFSIRMNQPDSDLLDAWLRQYPAHPDILRDRLSIVVNEEPIPEHIPMLKEYANNRPVDPMPHRLLANIYLKSGTTEHLELAIEHLEFLDAREKRSRNYATILAKLHMVIGNKELAQEKMLRAIRIAPLNREVRELAATVAMWAGNLEAAEHHIDILTKLEPQDINSVRLTRIRELRKEKSKTN